MNNPFHILLQKLGDLRGDHKHDGNPQESTKDGQEGEKASVNLKSGELAATVDGVPVLGLVIGLWVTIVMYVLYSQEWIARRDRRWRLRDQSQPQQGGQ